MLKTRYEDIITALSHIQSAYMSAVLTLVKTLEEAGSIRAEDYEDKLRSLAGGWPGRDEPVAILLEDLADAMNWEERVKQ